MSYDKQPSIRFAEGAGKAIRSWADIAGHVRDSAKEIVCVESYPGVNLAEVEAGLAGVFDASLIIRTADLMLDQSSLDDLLRSFLTDDRVFGYMAPFQMADLFDADAVHAARNRIEDARKTGTPVLVIGTGAALLADVSYLVYADMPRWEIQKRMRAGLPNLTANNPNEDFLVKYKRAYFIEWRIADRWKMKHFDRIDVFLDTTLPDNPRAVDGVTMRKALAHSVTRPFRVVPFFDPGVWGGQWMKKHFDLPDGPPNYAWGFDCVPEENSLLIDFGDIRMEVPSINVVLRHPEPLLGPKVYSRFGPEFPIRFDFLDTVEGGNLSLQVHPLTGYARDKFGIAYTQDESYYILEADDSACVYLGFQDGITKSDFFTALETAQSGGAPLDVDKFVNRWPANKHDHFSIPAGTIHCSGSGTVVLEISATPYIFTFKLWDWGRLGLDGRPRPVHVDHGRAVLREERNTAWAKRELIDRVDVLSDQDGIREERTGLHELEFIETRRHWFTETVIHHTEGSVHVLNLVEGDDIIVESPDGHFEPFTAGYAETFIVPAAIGTYTVRPVNPDRRHATVRASVRI
ncbi:MAG: mannose-6-phosphate isomerase [Rhizobium sp.]|nr:mannose-6-phosphate isomerase [Rhizobium sp.]